MCRKNAKFTSPRQSPLYPAECRNALFSVEKRLDFRGSGEKHRREGALGREAARVRAHGKHLVLFSDGLGGGVEREAVEQEEGACMGVVILNGRG